MSASKAEQYRADVLVSCVHDREPGLMPALEEEVRRRGLEERSGSSMLAVEVFVPWGRCS